jgi:hypothetical protein
MVASETHRIPITEKETTELIRQGLAVNLAFGPGGVALIWEKGTMMPPAVRHLGLMRGVLNENVDGAGI